ncbi:MULTISPECIES: hypothetical protein [Methylobacterium]|jgi:hypothetical protein|uniref:Uncharacterized protein n=2 Tax=Methylobacterium TaxID=407 RepID=A0A2U8VSJ7_9HYPH|nr:MULTISPECIES: hypothetical protein [Methylobacterium]AWN36657.1 hypothetical protein DK427_13680 [Methylobacterium radiodurans]GJD54995.1 hypothetical protein IFDJLNFL_0877 [Methylobacterium dankookense]
MIPQWVMREVYGGPVEDEPTFADRGVTREHTARKRLSCEECPSGRGIQPGERYRVHVGLDDCGTFFCSRSCRVMPDACRAALPPEPVRAAPRGPALPFDPDNIPF